MVTTEQPLQYSHQLERNGKFHWMACRLDASRAQRIHEIEQCNIEWHLGKLASEIYHYIGAFPSDNLNELVAVIIVNRKSEILHHLETISCVPNRGAARFLLQLYAHYHPNMVLSGYCTVATKLFWQNQAWDVN